jgi:hypothetical protein
MGEDVLSVISNRILGGTVNDNMATRAQFAT